MILGGPFVLGTFVLEYRGMAVTKKKVFVGVSGGVDSSVSLALLRDQGYDVVGCFIKTWQPDFITCTWKEERRDAMRVCAKLGVPFITIDAEQAYKDKVGQYFIDEYRAGRTPNPDVMCNREIKFGVFLDYALKHGADYVATGHYARIENGQLLAGADVAKDQSYFLWTLTSHQLSHIIFPIGHLKKTEVRNLAAKYGLSTAEKKDSQGVCFLGPVDMKDFLSHYIDKKRGDVLDTDGNIIGHHDGALFFTLGERHGFTITKKGSDDSRLYVVNRDLSNNTVTVSGRGPASTKAAQARIKIEGENWIQRPESGKKYAARIRYQQPVQPCHVEGDVVVFDTPQESASSGQSVVVYDGEVCLGGGIIA